MADNKIATLNDTFRKTFFGGRVILTPGVASLDNLQRRALMNAVRTFDDFKKDEDDPYGEHDFGAIDFDRTKYFWKIDYYDRSMEYGSDDPADPNKTMRVLTVMRADEY